MNVTTKSLKSQFNFFFDRVDYFEAIGRGFSVFNCPVNFAEKFIDKCKNNQLNSKYIVISKDINQLDANLFKNINNLPKIFVIYQDVNLQDFSKNVQIIVDKLIYPLWYYKIPICFFSSLDETEYQKKDISSSNIHNNFLGVINFLIREQLISLLNSANYKFSSPDFLDLSPDKTIFTPIEEKMKDALEKSKLIYEPQARIGRYYVDFLVTVNTQRVIVECDGRLYHNSLKDQDRDKVLGTEQYPILRFSGSDIYRNIDACINKIKQSAKIITKPKYEIDADLDNSQEKAINIIDGPIRVLAPAGSGKTKTLINRVVSLANNSIPGDEILALAFNKQAANEMKARLNNKLINNVEIRTFHSFGNKIIKDNLSWKFDAESQKQKTREFMKSSVERYIKIPARRNFDVLDQFLDSLSRVKAELPPLNEVKIELEGKEIQFEKIFNEFLRQQTKHNFFNFDDMIYLAIRILLNNDALRHDYQNKYRYILVDEFQDLNKAQLLLVQILHLPDNNIFVVGDDDQMIYGWRGAEIRHILGFAKKYLISKDYTLSTNYRSSKNIVSHSSWLIDNNQDRVKKNIQARKDAKQGVFDIKLQNSIWEQAQSAIKWILKLKKEKNLHWNDFAILFRYNAHQFPLALAFSNAQIPHSPVNGAHLFKTRVGQDIWAYLSVLIKPQEAKPQDFSRILKRPNKYIKNVDIAKIKSWSNFDNALYLINFKSLVQKNVNDFLKRIKKLQRIARQDKISPSAFLSFLRNEIGLNSFYENQEKKDIGLDEASDTILLDIICSMSNNFDTLLDFYEYVYQKLNTEEIEEEEEEQKDEITLSTIHKSKGTEFKDVVYYNLEPMKDVLTDAELEEERRVSYVAATRAIDNILVTAPLEEQSPFLKELALNPAFNDVTKPTLAIDLGQNQRNLDLNKSKCQTLQNKKEDLLVQYPELQGKPGAKHKGIMAKMLYWFRDKKLKKAARQIDDIDYKHKNIENNVIAPIKENIEQIKTEIKFRDLLLG